MEGAAGLPTTSSTKCNLPNIGLGEFDECRSPVGVLSCRTWRSPSALPLQSPLCASFAEGPVLSATNFTKPGPTVRQASTTRSLHPHRGPGPLGRTGGRPRPNRQRMERGVGGGNQGSFGLLGDRVDPHPPLSNHQQLHRTGHSGQRWFAWLCRKPHPMHVESACSSFNIKAAGHTLGRCQSLAF